MDVTRDEDDAAAAVPTRSGGGVDQDASASASASSSSPSEDFLIFGARPTQLFDDVSSAVDALLAEEASTLPLLPRVLTERERREYRERQQRGEKTTTTTMPPTGEEKLLTRLRKAYKKNLDIAEAYCARNIFTVGHYPKTKRRLILERYLAREEEEEEEEKDGDGGIGGKKADDDEDGRAAATTTTTSDPPTLPAAVDGTVEGSTTVVPTPDQISGADVAIVETRARIRREKGRRARLTRQLERLNAATETLREVRDALRTATTTTAAAAGGEVDDGDEEGGGGGGGGGMEKLKESVRRAVEGHEELGAWNSRAEEAIRILDRIKVDREGGVGVGGGGGNDHRGKVAAAAPGKGGKVTVAAREVDERERKRAMEEIGAGSHGTKEQVESFLKKLRGN